MILLPQPDPLFEPDPDSHVGKVRCRVCQRSGYPTNGGGWQRRHIRGHSPCPGCGRPMTLNLDGTAQKHRCDQCAKAQAAQADPTRQECPERKGETHHLIPRRIHGTASTELACVWCKKTEKQLREEQG